MLDVLYIETPINIETPIKTTFSMLKKYTF